MKITQPKQPVSLALNVPASGVGVDNSGGYFPDPATVQIILDFIAAGGLGAYLRTTLGGVGVVQALGTLGATQTIDLANANYFAGTLAEDCVLTTVGWTNLKDCQITVELTGDGASTATFDGWTWIGSAPGVIGSGDVLHAVGFSRTGGATIWGVVVGGTPVTSLDDLSDVILTSPATADRLRFDGSVWRNSALKWKPVLAFDPTSGLYVNVHAGGDPVMAEG
jgi:hypothetical protein